MQKILLCGGNGLIGNKIKEILGNLSIEFNILTRNPKHENEYFWDIENNKIDIKAFDHVTHIIHLAGAGVAEHRWTKNYKSEIISSRVKSTDLLYRTVVENNFPIQQYTGASAVGYYGDCGEKLLEETAGSGTDFLSTTCQLWEKAHLQFETLCNVSIIRIGVVLSKEGGAYPKLVLPTKFGMAPYLGNGKQFMSWIHIDDIAQIIFLATQNKWKGVFNGVAPEAVSNKEFMLHLSKNKKVLMPSTPQFVLRALMGEQADMVLLSQKVSAEKVLKQNFQYSFASLSAALKDLMC